MTPEQMAENLRVAGELEGRAAKLMVPGIIRIRPRWWLWWSPRAWRAAKLAEALVNWALVNERRNHEKGTR